jgi:PAS domain S-box-containing protein
MKNYFSNLKIMQKFLMIFSFVLVSVLASYAVVFWFSAKQKTQGTQIDISGRNRMLSQRIGAMSLLIDTDNETQASVAKEEMRKAIVLLEQTLHVLKNGGIAPGVEGNIVLPPAPDIIVPKITEVEDFFKGHKETANVLLNESRLIESTSSGDSTRSANIINLAFKDALDKLRQRLINGTLLKMNIELTQLFTQQAVESRRAFTVMLIALLLINVFVIGFAFMFLRNTLKPLEPITSHIATLSEGHIPPSMKMDRNDEIGKMAMALNALSENLGSATEFAKNVGEGKLDTQVQVFGGKGDLSQSLYAMRDNLKTVAEEDKKRNWTTEGLAKFSDILRANTDLKAFGENVISNLVKYTGSNQGSLFIVDDGNPANVHLELLACYAFDRKKFLEKKIMPGEGLAGQVYLEKETIFIKDIPKNYISITSGLGEANPRSLLIVPLKLNEAIAGIVEIASFKEYLSHEISFIEKLAENIASTITGVKINERTQRLLQSSQQQAEELKAQEEEMRQNMEELSATQEEISRRQLDNENVIKAIDSSFAVVEFDPTGIILNANQNFTDLMGYTLYEIKGQHHRMFAEPALRSDKDYLQFWDDLAKGLEQKGKFKRINKRGEAVWINGSYAPMHDKNGNIVKIMKIAFNITAMIQNEIQYLEQINELKSKLGTTNNNETKRVIEQLADDKKSSLQHKKMGYAQPTTNSHPVEEDASSGSSMI